MSYPKITQQLLFSTVVSSLDMLKQLTQKLLFSTVVSSLDMLKQVTQQLLFSTVVSSLDMLKQSHSGIKSIQQHEHHMNARFHIWDRDSKWVKR